MSLKSCLQQHLELLTTGYIRQFIGFKKESTDCFIIYETINHYAERVFYVNHFKISFVYKINPIKRNILQLVYLEHFEVVNQHLVEECFMNLIIEIIHYQIMI